MDLGFNKIAFCVLATGLVIIGAQQGSAAFFQHEEEGHGHESKEVKYGWLVPVEEAKSEGPAVVEGPRDYFTLISEANPANGKEQATKCKACHNLEPGGGVIQGPPLYGVVGRPIGTVAGFKYSAAIEGKKPASWDYDHLDHFLENPKKYAPGTAMGFLGIKNIKDRSDTIAYLRTLTAGEPLALPAKLEVTAPPAPAEGASPAEGPAAAGGAPAPTASGSPAAPAAGASSPAPAPTPTAAASPSGPKPSPAATKPAPAMPKPAPATTTAPSPAPAPH
jgi:cytochrome c